MHVLKQLVLQFQMISLRLTIMSFSRDLLHKEAVEFVGQVIININNYFCKYFKTTNTLSLAHSTFFKSCLFNVPLLFGTNKNCISSDIFFEYVMPFTQCTLVALYGSRRKYYYIGPPSSDSIVKFRF